MTQIGKYWFKQPTKSQSPIYWYNKKTKVYLYLFRENHKEDKFNKNKVKWKVLLGGENLGEFDKKEQALEFMEEYMLEHQE